MNQQDKITIEQVEQPLDESLTSAIKSFWIEQDAGVADLDQRLSEVKMIARCDGEIAGVLTATLVKPTLLTYPLINCRLLIGEKFRQENLAYTLHQRAVQQFESDFNAGLDTSAIGVLAVTEAKFVLASGEARCRWGYPVDENGPLIEFNLFGVKSDGRPQYVHFFEHASLFAEGPVVEPPKTRLQDKDPDIRLTFTWGKLTEQEAQQVLGLWLANGVMKSREACLERLPQVAALAWKGDRVVGVASLFEVPYEPANAEFYGYRSFISPEARGSASATKLLNLTYEELNKLSQAGALPSSFHGIAYVLQNEQLNKHVHKPMGPDLRSVFIGFLDNMQLRVKYFDGAKVQLKRATTLH